MKSNYQSHFEAYDFKCLKFLNKLISFLDYNFWKRKEGNKFMDCSLIFRNVILISLSKCNQFEVFYEVFLVALWCIILQFYSLSKCKMCQHCTVKLILE